VRRAVAADVATQHEGRGDGQARAGAVARAAARLGRRSKWLQAGSCISRTADMRPTR
jgi:hypothetical protein